MKKFLLLIILAAGILPLCAQTPDNASLFLQQKKLLSEATTPADSMRILFNLFDLAPIGTSKGMNEAREINHQMVKLALKTKKYDVAFDMIRNVSNLFLRVDSVQNHLWQLTMQFPDSPDRDQTLTFIRMTRNSAQLRFSPDDEKFEALTEKLAEIEDGKVESIYDRMVLLHAICICLNDYPSEDITKRYVKELSNIADKMPEKFYALRNNIYVNSAMSYTATEEYAKAIEYDKKLLDIMNRMEKRNKKLGREFKNYSANRYIIYNRMLGNYPALTPAEIEEYYQKALEAAEIDSRAASTMKKAPLPTIFHAMANKDYATALPLLKQCVNSNLSTIASRRAKLLRMTIESAKALNDQTTLNEIYPLYIDVLEKKAASQLQDKYRILQVLYEVDEMRDENNRLIQENQTQNRRRWRLISIFSIIAAVGLLVIVLLLYRAYRRRKLLTEELEKSNRDLQEESQKLLEARNEIVHARDKAEKANQLKTDFINNMSHEVKAPRQALTEYSYLIAESVEDHKKKYLTQFADLLMLNSELVTTIVNDVLQLADIHNKSVAVEPKSISLDPLCEAAIVTVKHRVQPGVELRFIPNGNPSVYADNRRLMQILINLLINAAKFTESGSINLTYDVDEEKKVVNIAVTDTGIGISEKNAERIFERFVKINSDSQGAGLGLTISRALAELMGGNVILDTKYTAGARFVITIPMPE